MIKKRKKIILSAYACSPIKGSEEGNGWNWALNLAQQGFDVWCLTNTQDEEQIVQERQRLDIDNLHFVFVKVPFGIDKSFFDPASKKVYLHYLLWRKRANKIAQKMHNTLNFDIAHHVTYGSLQQGTFLYKLKGVKLIFGPVGGGQMAMPSFKEYFGKAWKTEVIRGIISRISFLYNRNLKQTIRLAEHILVTNKETEDLVKATRYYDKSRVYLVLDNAVPPSMEKALYPDRNYEGTLKLLWVGRILPRKGLNLVLHALSCIPDEVDYVLTVVGGGPCFDDLENWIQHYRLNPKRIKIMGAIPFSDVIEYYKKSDVFVFCSLRDSCPSQINEAMAFGLPPIVLNIHGSALAVADGCGIRVNATTPEVTAQGIAQAITSLYFNRNLLSKMSQASFAYAKNNTWKRKVQQVVDIVY